MIKTIIKNDSIVAINSNGTEVLIEKASPSWSEETTFLYLKDCLDNIHLFGYSISSQYLIETNQFIPRIWE